ncbi:hypothetical protein [Flavobacterium aciduliphilum]|uniref:Uncharacterized protein n=1 Tax=Flavobacterium aciduliphilum TaxID=1101402 RepID=A0A328YD87_9FLAO|nr:hypothetical protein [Flavobacterium aciduliphilum]RAR70072.1 hypothetical protein CLV55_11361 [Flavobacterium aciduliphilum]
MKKLFIALILFSITYTNVVAQEIEIKDNKVLLDGKEFLKYEKSNIFNHSFYSLLNDDEILFFRFDQNETPNYLDDDYFVLNFLTEKIKIESKNKSKVFAGLGMNSRKNMEKMITWLLSEKVLNPDGTINRQKLEIFHEKYDENITNRTIRN